MAAFISASVVNAKIADPINAEIDGLRIEVTRPEDLAVSVDGIPVLSAPELYLVSKNWSRKYYAFEDDGGCLLKRRVEQTTGGGLRVVFPLKSPNHEFHGQLIYEIKPGKKLSLFVQGELTSPTEARVEHRFGRCAPGWFMGRAWQAKYSDGTTTHGVAPILARSGSLKDMTLVESFRELQLDSRLYRLQMKTRGDFRFALLDYRMSPYNAGELCYWLGILESKIEPLKPFEYSLEIAFVPREERLSSEVSATTEPVQSVACVLTGEKGIDRILPTPKCIQWHRKVLVLPSRLPVYMSGASSSEERKSAEELIANIFGREARRFGVEVEISGDSPVSTTALYVRFSKSAKSAEDEGKFDYYRLSSTEHGIQIDAGTTGGLRAGLASLIQLLQWSEGRPVVRQCSIEDYSAMPVRAVHFFTGKNGRDLQINMLRTVLLPLKYNMLIYQCDYLEWESVPQLRHEKYGMRKDDAAAVIEEARRLGFEVVPLVNTFGHCEWLLENEHFRQLADNPEKPYAYDPSNPQVYELCERIYAEALDLFQPRLFHIGHDEVTLHGFPEKPQNRQRGAETLFYEDTMHYYRWLKQRGVRMIMWGDQLLAPGEGAVPTLAHSLEQARNLREKLPKDIIIADWHYDPNPPEDFVNLRVLTEAGFDVIACTWYSPLNILRFAKAVELERQRDSQRNSLLPSQPNGKVLGLMQTTWAGFSFDQESFDSSLDQYAAYVLAGHAAWCGGARELREVPFDYRAEFGRLWTHDLLPPGEGKGWTADLGSVANLPLDGSLACELVTGLPHVSSFSNLKAGEQRMERWLVRIPKRGNAAGAVLFEGQFNPEGPWLKELTVPVNRKADAIFFVVASTVAGPGRTSIATTNVVFEDGTTSTLDWRPSVNVFGLEDGRCAPRAPIVWENHETGKAPRFVHGFVWKNPHPLKQIKLLKTESTNRGGALLLFAISGLEVQ